MSLLRRRIVPELDRLLSSTIPRAQPAALNPPDRPIERIMGRMALNFWSTPAHAILTMLAGWIHREQEAVVVYQKEEIRALTEMLGGERLASPTHSAAA